MMEAILEVWVDLVVMIETNNVEKVMVMAVLVMEVVVEELFHWLRFRG
jgi:hypothetical protein